MKKLIFTLWLLSCTAVAQVKSPITLEELASKSLASMQKISVVQQIGAFYLNGGASPALDAQCMSALTALRADTVEAQQITRTVSAYLSSVPGLRTSRTESLNAVSNILYSQRLALYSALSPLCANREDMSPKTAFFISSLYLNTATLNATMLNLYLKLP